MATVSDASSVLETTHGKRNFQRITRLLVAGGTSMLREVFDSIRPPPTLSVALADPLVKNQLRSAKLTKPQRDSLYPPSGVCTKSSDFDITLLFCLLRRICGLPSPPLGWDKLPATADQTMSADLARVKFYRNTVYGHVSGAMEISDDKFNDLWAEISEALIRLANYISGVKGLEWQQAITELQNAPLTPEDEQNVEELKMWYKSDYETKEMVERVDQHMTMGLEQVNERMDRFTGALS